MGNITYSLTKVSSAISDKPLYRANVPTNQLLGHAELSELLAKRTKHDAAFWKYFLDVLSSEIDTQLLEGNRIKLGSLSTCFAIRGTFESEDERFDQKKHQLVTTVRIQDPLKSALAKIVPENITHGITCAIYSVMDSVTKCIAEIIGSNRILIQGKNLGISPDNPDEGVWLKDPKTGKTVAMSIIERSDSQTIDCAFPARPRLARTRLLSAVATGRDPP